MSKLANIILMVVLIVCFTGIGFFAGILLGSKKILPSTRKQIEIETIKKVEQRIGSIPWFTPPPDLSAPDSIRGEIKELSNNFVRIIEPAQSFQEALWQDPREKDIEITIDTKILYYTYEANPNYLENNGDPNVSPNLATQHLLNQTDLKIGENILVIVNPEDKGKPEVKALEIRLNR